MAAQRSQAAREAAARVFRSIALRNSLSASVAASASQSEATVAQARADAAVTGKTYLKRWVSRRIPGVTCAWCWNLHGAVVGLDEEFPHPGDEGGRKPPRLWRGVLHGPPLHPHCLCEIEITEAPEAPVPEPQATPEEAPHQYVRSSDIRDLPEERYQGLVAFLRGALHELSLVVRRLLGVGR